MSDKLQGGVLAGSTSLSLPILLRKTADNTEQTGKVASDMTGSYLRQGGTRTSISLSDLAAVNSAYSSGGVKEIDSTNMPGLYRLDVPDAAIATGADWVVISIKVGSTYLFFERFNLTTNVAQTGDAYAVANGRLPAALTSNGNIKASLMEILTTALTETAGQLAGGFKKFFNIATPAATMDHGILVDTATALTNAPLDSSGVTTLLSRLTAARAGYLDNLSAGAVALEASLQGLITTVGVAGAGLTAADDAVIAAIAALNNLSQANVRTALGMASANLDTQLAAIAGYIDTEVAAIKAKTDNLPSDPADASDIAASFSSIAATLATIASYIDTEVAAIKAKTDNLPPDPADASDVAASFASLASTLTGISARIPAALTGAGNIKSDALAINGSTAAAVRLALSAEVIVPGTIDTAGFSPTTVAFEADDITEATADHYNGRIIIFTSGALLGQATSISDYSLSGGRGHFTVVALTEAPSNNDTFVIV